MRSQIAITRGGVTKASTGKAPPDGGVLARRVNGSFTISLHRKVSEMALAIQAPLFQHGFLRLHGGTMRPFQRIIYPITPAGDRPSNFRVLTTAELMESPDLIII